MTIPFSVVRSPTTKMDRGRPARFKAFDSSVIGSSAAASEKLKLSHLLSARLFQAMHFGIVLEIANA
jgi:hypothetical protein